MRAILFTVLFSISIHAGAQRTCATSQYNLQQQANYPATANSQTSIENFIQQQSFPGSAESIESTSANNIIRIPVVIHVLYNSEAQNISDAQIKSGLEALNRDFRRHNRDTANTPERFKALAADVEIEFVLATADPKGRATTGIERKRTSVATWKMDDKIKESIYGGADAWDTKSYLNIWLGTMRNLLGYASAPGASSATDGLVINTANFGTLNSSAPYNLGRTAVHEAGHWLGLKHIWGDTYCGDDLVYDTPTQGNFTTGNPTGFRTSCSNGATGDMYMNYMDFTDDAGMNLFTQGQKQRMRMLFNYGGPRASLLQSKGLHKPWLAEAPLAEEIKTVETSRFKVYPNPALSYIVLDFSYDESWVGKEINLLNANGILIKKEMISQKSQKVSLVNLKAGIYFIRAQNGQQKINQKFIKL